MKRLLILLLLLPSLAWGQDYARLGTAIIGGGASAACTPTTGSCTNATTGECGTTYLACEDFEGSTDCNIVAGNLPYCRATYTSCDGYGTYNDDSASKIEGSYSYHNNTKWPCEYIATFSGISPAYAFGKVRFIRDADDAANFLWKFDTADAFDPTISVVTAADGTGYRLDAAGCGSTGWGSTKLSYGTVYNIWMEYTKGTGANSKLDLYVSSTSTKGSVYASYSDGNCQGNATGFWLGTSGAQTSIDVYEDHFRVSATQMTGVPD